MGKLFQVCECCGSTLDANNPGQVIEIKEGNVTSYKRACTTCATLKQNLKEEMLLEG